MLAAIIKELKLRSDEIKKEPIETIYFGGGSPSIWPVEYIGQILNAIKAIASTVQVRELTLEANPDDLSLSFCAALAAHGINRLSIGIQSFYDEELRWMNRAHNSRQAHKSIENAKTTGINNLSVDLIYGSPLSSMKSWEKNLNYFKEYQVDHLSAYMLTVEPKTALGHAVEKGTIKVPDQPAIKQFTYLKEWARKHSLAHYEISNFCFNGKKALHNSNYWNGSAYIGIGPGAHSFDGEKKRSWNIANNTKYIAALAKGQLPSTYETLSQTDSFNEALMIGLRQIEGLPIIELRKAFKNEFITELKTNLASIPKNWLRITKQKIQLKDEGILHADAIISDLMITG